jgi:hypothetical protein
VDLGPARDGLEDGAMPRALAIWSALSRRRPALQAHRSSTSYPTVAAYSRAIARPARRLLRGRAQARADGPGRRCRRRAQAMERAPATRRLPLGPPASRGRDASRRVGGGARAVARAGAAFSCRLGFRAGRYEAAVVFRPRRDGRPPEFPWAFLRRGPLLDGRRFLAGLGRLPPTAHACSSSGPACSTRIVFLSPARLKTPTLSSATSRVPRAWSSCACSATTSDGLLRGREVALVAKMLVCRAGQDRRSSRAGTALAGPLARTLQTREAAAGHEIAACAVSSFDTMLALAATPAGDGGGVLLRSGGWSTDVAVDRDDEHLFFSRGSAPQRQRPLQRPCARLTRDHATYSPLAGYMRRAFRRSLR